MVYTENEEINAMRPNRAPWYEQKHLPHHSSGSRCVGEAGDSSDLKNFQISKYLLGLLGMDHAKYEDILVKHKIHTVLAFVEHIFMNFMGPVRVVGSAWAPSLAFCGEENFCTYGRADSLLLLQFRLQLPCNSRLSSLPPTFQNQDLDSGVDKAHHRPRDTRGGSSEIPSYSDFLSQMGGKGLLH